MQITVYLINHSRKDQVVYYRFHILIENNNYCHTCMDSPNWVHNNTQRLIQLYFWRILFATMSQFHQCSTSSFNANSLLPKEYKVKLYVQKSCSKHFCTKKPVVKCWWNWPHLTHPILLSHLFRLTLSSLGMLMSIRLMHARLILESYFAASASVQQLTRHSLVFAFAVDSVPLNMLSFESSCHELQEYGFRS